MALVKISSVNLAGSCENVVVFANLTGTVTLSNSSVMIPMIEYETTSENSRVLSSIAWADGVIKHRVLIWS